MKTLGMVLSGQDNNAGADEKLKRKRVWPRACGGVANLYCLLTGAHEK
jgi:hypothetical protein